MSTHNIAKFIRKTSYKDIPAEGLYIAKRGILDYLGVAIGGSKEPAVEILFDYVRQMGTALEASVVGRKYKTTTELAAWLNGTSGHALDYDDTDSIAFGYNMHPSVPILPAVLALAEKYKLSGKVVISSYIIGFEVESRIGSAIGQQNSEAGWHPTAIIGSFGATAASAKILNLKVREIQNAFGIVGSIVGGLLCNFGTMTKAMHAGNAARNGVVAAILALEGFTANENIMDGTYGICDQFSNHKITEIGKSAKDIGVVWDIIKKGFAFKPYPSCRDTHGCIDSTLTLRKKYNISIHDVDSVICKINTKQARNLRFNKPKNAMEAKFSMPYCIAGILLKGSLNIEDFSYEAISKFPLKNFYEKVKIIHSDRSDFSQEVFIKLKNGKNYSQKTTAAKGDPKNQISDSELYDKFKDCTKLRIKNKDAEKLIKSIMNIEKIENIADLIKKIKYFS